jgi:D-glycero-alpha-D-manno-heptose-7-phosphate kinase
MIISRTPLRISFVGGGSDLAAFYGREPGAVVSTAIDKYIITVNRKFDRKIRASYSVTEIVDGVDDLKHELIREALKLVGIDGGIEITSISDIPSEGTGLGSSSTYTVGLLSALYAYAGRHVGAERLAHEACEIEIERCGKPIGKQDQYIAAYGGLQYIRFNPDESVYVDPVTCGREVKQRLQERLMLFYMGTFPRSARDILAEQKASTEANPIVRHSLQNIVALADRMRECLLRGELDSVGGILHEGWSEKKKLAASISSNRIDGWYECALKHGASGGKVLGAGGGGFLLLFAPPERHACIADALPELRRVPFRFEP